MPTVEIKTSEIQDALFEGVCAAYDADWTLEDIIKAIRSSFEICERTNNERLAAEKA